MKTSKILLFISIILVIVLLGCTEQEEIKDLALEPAETVHFEFKGYSETFQPNITTPLPTMGTNPVWNKMPLKLYLDRDFETEYTWFDTNVIEEVEKAMQEWENATDGLVLFEEADNIEDADIIFEWSKHQGPTGQGIKIGEARPDAAYTGLFTVLTGGTMTQTMYFTSCVNKIITIHELGHMMGLGHSENPKSVMYPYAWCYQTITDEEIETLSNLNNIEKDDLQLVNASIDKVGDYLSGELIIQNRGANNAQDIEFVLKTENNVIFKDTIDSLDYGYTTKFWFKNIEFEGEVSSLTIEINPNNNPPEFIRENNVIILTIYK